MENLLNQKGKYFTTSSINGSKEIAGMIQVEDGMVFLCQNTKDGRDCRNKLGFKYSWCVNTGNEFGLRSNSVKGFKIITKSKFNKIKEKLPLVFHRWNVDILSKGKYSFGCGEVQLTKQEIRNWYKIHSMKRSLIITPSMMKSYIKINEILQIRDIKINSFHIEQIKNLIK